MKVIAILSVPRSGSTWLGQIFNSSPDVLYRFQPNFAYTFPLTLNLNSTTEEIQHFHKMLRNTKDPFVSGQLSISNKRNIEFPKSQPNILVWKETHYLFLAELLLRNSDTKVIGLIRSPFSVIASWIKIPKEFNPEWSIKDQWRSAELKNEGRPTHYFGFEKWKETALMFLRLQRDYSGRFCIVNYDDLLMTTVDTVSRLFEFSGLDMSNQTLDFLNNSRSISVDDAYGVFKNKSNDEAWKNELPSYIIETILADPVFCELNKSYNWIE